MTCYSGKPAQHRVLVAAADVASGAPIIAVSGLALLSDAESVSDALCCLGVAVIAFWSARNAIWNICCRFNGHPKCHVLLLRSDAPFAMVPQSRLGSTIVFSTIAAACNTALLARVIGMWQGIHL